MTGVFKKTTRFLFLGLVVTLTGHAQNIPTEFYNGQEAVANEVLVKFSAVSLISLIQAESVENVDRAQGIGGTGVLRFHSASKNVATLIGELSARPDVQYVEPNYIVRPVTVPNDPYFSELWGLHNTGQTILGQPGKPGADIGAVSAWDISTGSRANVAAVIDTGVDYTHPDLAANIWSAPRTFVVNIGGLPIICLAGSHGFNAITNVCDPLDDDNHGTHVSGTIGAVGNNGVGVVGVNWTASIMGVKFEIAAGYGLTSDAINAIEFTIQAKAAFAATGEANVRVLSNSWGGSSFSQALLDEINRADANDMLFVAAAGNQSSNNDVSPFYPASYKAPNIVAVAATDNTDALASFSDFGATSVHLGAPGVNVLSLGFGGNYGHSSGTSMATPHVSGSALLILSACSLNTAALKAVVLNNVDPVPSLTGITITGGRLNVNKAIRACSGAPTNLTSTLSVP